MYESLKELQFLYSCSHNQLTFQSCWVSQLTHPMQEVYPVDHQQISIPTLDEKQMHQHQRALWCCQLEEEQNMIKGLVYHLKEANLFNHQQERNMPLPYYAVMCNEQHRYECCTLESNHLHKPRTEKTEWKKKIRKTCPEF